MTTKERVFIETVWAYYRAHGRAHLPWRKKPNSYHVLVSEVMLQQTQVSRVIPKYTEFTRAFPTLRALAAAPLFEVLQAWQGLGYNRRAKMLHMCAKAVVERHNGILPRTYEPLVALPGIGPYTASAVLVFAYNTPSVMIETNIRSVYLHHFFRDKNNVPDSKLLPYITRTMDHERPREWFAALMDYGTHVKSALPNPSRKSAHHARQKPFEGSDRKIRGEILRMVLLKPRTQRFLTSHLSVESSRCERILTRLVHDGLLERVGSYYQAPRS